MLGRHPHQPRPDQRHERHDQAEPVGNPRQPAGEELIALRPGQFRAAEEDRAGMALHDLHRAIDPAIALAHEGLQRVGRQPVPHALRNVGGAIARLEQFEAEFGVLGDAPCRPAADFFQRVLAHDGHGAVLDDGVVFVALDHADVEEAAIFLVAHRLEHAVAARRDNPAAPAPARFRRREQRQRAAQPDTARPDSRCRSRRYSCAPGSVSSSALFSAPALKPFTLSIWKKRKRGPSVAQCASTGRHTASSAVLLSSTMTSKFS